MSSDQPIKISRAKKTVRRAKVGEIYSLSDKFVEKLQELVKRGYSYEKISGILVEKGIKISVSTLKQHLDPDLAAVKRKSTTSNVTRRKSSSKPKQKASQIGAEDETEKIKRVIDYSEPTLSEVVQLSQKSGAFDFLDNEPDLYTAEDGDSVW